MTSTELHPGSDPDTPFVSVVVPHYNDFSALAQSLAALRQQRWPADRYEIIVADNNSIGGVERVAQMAPDVRVVPAPEQGAGPARNAGVAVARGDVFAFIDSDCIADADWLAAGMEGLRRFDYAGGQVIVKPGRHSHVTPAEAYELVFAFNFKKYIEHDRFSGSGNLFVPRAVFAAVGGFRNGMSEDIDWCRRANALGYRLGYVADAVVCHTARLEWHELIRKWDRVIAEHYLLARQRPGWWSRWLVHTLLVIVSPFPHALRVAASPKLYGVRAKLTGIASLFALRYYRAWQMLRYLVRGPRRRTATGGLSRDCG